MTREACNCRSHNHGVGTVPERVVPHPTEPGRTVCLDACIADAVLHLWANGVHTLASCCGHGRTTPGIVLSTPRDVPAAERLIGEREPGRRIELHAWVLASLGLSGA